MNRMKLFIASSGQKALLAEALQRKIEEASRRANLPVDVVPWYRDGAFPPGTDVLASLIDHCRGGNGISGSDFFAALLTKDDEVEKKGQRGESPRDNCIFELGLFLGALGFDPRRCCMVASVAQSSLPSDLLGRTYLHIDEPADLNDPEACAAAVESAAQTIRDQIRKLGPYRQVSAAGSK